MATAQMGRLLRHIRKLADGPSAAHWTDDQLIDAFAACRDETAFTTLVARHGPMVLRVCRRVLHHEQDAEDAFQATFLVLAKNITSIRKHQALAAWLHGVAYRTAMKTKRSAARRRKHEARLPTLAPRPTPGLEWAEVQVALDEEIERLSEHHRKAFVLCVLESKSVPEAAAELGCKQGTVSSWLTRARWQLQRRLARRGIKLPALLAALSIAESGSKAAVPAALAHTTIRFGLWVAAGKTAAGTIPLHVAALAAGVTRAMFLTKAKVALVLLFAAGMLVAAGGALAYQTRPVGEEIPPAAAGSPAPKADTAPPSARPDDAGGKATFSGHVLDPEGKPFSGAKLHLIGRIFTRPRPVLVQGMSAADGAFRLAVAPADARLLADDASWGTTGVVAMAEGYGPAVRGIGAFQPAADLTLRLAKDDVPVRGRILDLQGKPLPGVTVRVEALSAPRGDNLTAWLAALEANKQDGYAIEYRYLESEVRLAETPGIYPPVVTDAEGRFQVKGVGRERLVQLVLEGPTIALERVRVYTRPGKTIHAAGFARDPDGPRLTYYGAEFDLTAAPTRPIVGVVRDKDTGKPLAGVTIQSHKFAGVNTSGDSSVRTVTDKDGRYRLIGMPKGRDNIIKAAPAAGQPYFQAEQKVADPTGLDPVTVNFTLKRGVVVKGRVLDKATGEPLAASVGYVVFRDNPHHTQAPGLAVDHYLSTDDDGSFQLIAFPGRGLLCARGWSDHYRMGIGTDRIKGRYQQQLFDTLPHLQGINTAHTYLEINPSDDAESVTCELVLDPGTMLRGTLTGPDGKPVAGAQALGLTAYSRSRNWTRIPLKGDAFIVYGLAPTDEREVVFVHMGKQLAALTRVRGDAKQPLAVKLEPWGTVTGRLVGPDGKPRPGVLLQVDDRLLPGASLQTDKEGHFRVAGLAPGVKYTVQVIQNGQPVADVFAGLALKAAEVRDLGDVVVQLRK